MTVLEVIAAVVAQLLERVATNDCAANVARPRVGVLTAVGRFTVTAAAAIVHAAAGAFAAGTATLLRGLHKLRV